MYIAAGGFCKLTKIEEDFLTYKKMLYLSDNTKPDSVPSGTGIYIQYENKKLNCGKSQDLDRRPIISGRNRFQRGPILIYHSNFMKIPKHLDVWSVVGKIEKLCISSLYSIIIGNGLPIRLFNIKDAYPLPDIAWSDDRPITFDIAIDIAQTALYETGIPLHLCQLPNYGLLMSAQIHSYMFRSDAQWQQIKKQERETRIKKNHNKPPLSILGYRKTPREFSWSPLLPPLIT